MTNKHQTRLDIISENISELQKSQITSMAKIAQEETQGSLSQNIIGSNQNKKSNGQQLLHYADEDQLWVQLDNYSGQSNAPTYF